MEINLSHKNIELRALEPEDIDFLYRLENDTKLWQISSTTAPFSKHILNQYIQNAHLDIYTSRQQRWVIQEHSSQLPVGCIDLFDFDPFHNRVGIGLVVCEAYRKKGYAKQALELLISYSLDYLSVHQIFANILTDNQPSINLFTAFGFDCIGIKKQWIKCGASYKDEALYQLINNNK